MINIDVFQIAISTETGNILLCFTGPYKIINGDKISFDGTNFLLERKFGDPLKFVNINEKCLPYIKEAYKNKEIFINRTFEFGQDYFNKLEWT